MSSLVSYSVKKNKRQLNAVRKVLDKRGINLDTGNILLRKVSHDIKNTKITLRGDIGLAATYVKLGRSLLGKNAVDRKLSPNWNYYKRISKNITIETRQVNANLTEIIITAQSSQFYFAMGIMARIAEYNIGLKNIVTLIPLKTEQGIIDNQVIKNNKGLLKWSLAIQDLFAEDGISQCKFRHGVISYDGATSQYFISELSAHAAGAATGYANVRKLSYVPKAIGRVGSGETIPGIVERILGDLVPQWFIDATDGGGENDISTSQSPASYVSGAFGIKIIWAFDPANENAEHSKLSSWHIYNNELCAVAINISNSSVTKYRMTKVEKRDKNGLPIKGIMTYAGKAHAEMSGISNKLKDYTFSSIRLETCYPLEEEAKGTYTQFGTREEPNVLLEPPPEGQWSRLQKKFVLEPAVNASGTELAFVIKWEFERWYRDDIFSPVVPVPFILLTKLVRINLSSMTYAAKPISGHAGWGKFYYNDMPVKYARTDTDLHTWERGYISAIPQYGSEETHDTEPFKVWGSGHLLGTDINGNYLGMYCNENTEEGASDNTDTFTYKFGSKLENLGGALKVEYMGDAIKIHCVEYKTVYYAYHRYKHASGNVGKSAAGYYGEVDSPQNAGCEYNESDVLISGYPGYLPYQGRVGTHYPEDNKYETDKTFSLTVHEKMVVRDNSTTIKRLCDVWSKDEQEWYINGDPPPKITYTHGKEGYVLPISMEHGIYYHQFGHTIKVDN